MSICQRLHKHRHAMGVALLLLLATLSISAQESSGDSSLVKAARSGDANRVREILKETTSAHARAEALLNAVREGVSSFGFQVSPGFPKAELERIKAKELARYLEVATILLDGGADPNLLRLINYGCKDILGLRGVQECDPGMIVPWDKGELSVLGLAAQEKAVQFVDLLTARGARP